MNPELNPEDPLLFDAVEGLSVLFVTSVRFQFSLLAQTSDEGLRAPKPKMSEKRGFAQSSSYVIELSR